METNFFSVLDPVIDGFDLQLTIKKKEGKLTVGVFSIPRVDDKAAKHIRPLTLNGSAEELDNEFFKQIQEPLDLVSKWSVDMKDFENNMARVEAKSQRAKKEEEALRKKKSDAKVKLDRCKELLEADKPRQAITVLEQALELYPDYAEAKELLKEARAKASIGTGLFAEKESETEEDSNPTVENSDAEIYVEPKFEQDGSN